ncbi:MAG TPA: hypothetical protein VFM88_23915 [Vicinamibacteria bacterium]|nr:hypothetical protein [Vicinamibacteria bacterium]
MTEALRGLKWLEPPVDLLRLGCFALFVTLGLLAARAAGRPDHRRRVDLLIAYVLAVTGVVGLVQQESWPFTQWALVHHLSPKRIVSLELEAIDERGTSCVVDLRVLQPLAPEEFATWLKANLPRLGPRERERLGQFLLQRAEQGRQRYLAGGEAAPNRWILGPLAAPYHFHDARTWRSRADVPPTPFRRLRAWFLEWDVEQRLADPKRVDRRLLFEVPRRRTATTNPVPTS